MIVQASCRYAMLICSLPALPYQPFEVRQPPLSRLQLERRLALLEPEHRRELDLIENVAHWDRMTMNTSDLDLLRRARDALDILQSPTLRELIRWRLDLRVLIAALRIRRQDRDARVDPEVFGPIACADYIRRHWRRPDFGLSHVHPWLNEAQRRLGKGDHIGLERLLFDTVWKYLSAVAQDHHFDFEAVVLYVLRWNLVDRWIRYDNSEAQQRFLDLLKEGLGEHVTPYIRSL